MVQVFPSNSTAKLLTMVVPSTSRPAGDPCRATVAQRGDSFQPSQRSHNHPAQVGAALAAIVSAKVKAKAVQDLFKPAPAIVDDVSKTFLFHVRN